MTTIHNTMNANIANNIKMIQNICRGNSYDFFTIWAKSGKEFNDLAHLLTIMVEGKLITKRGEGMRDSVYSY